MQDAVEVNKVVLGQGVILAPDRHSTQLFVGRESAMLVPNGQIGGAKQPRREEEQGRDVLRRRGRGLVVCADALVVSNLGTHLME